MEIHVVQHFGCFLVFFTFLLHINEAICVIDKCFFLLLALLIRVIVNLCEQKLYDQIDVFVELVYS